jgi:hypothetical protein
MPNVAPEALLPLPAGDGVSITAPAASLRLPFFADARRCMLCYSQLASGRGSARRFERDPTSDLYGYSSFPTSSVVAVDVAACRIGA